MTALRWKKNDPERGLRRICAGPRGSKLRLDGIEVASIATYRPGFEMKGWYWVAGHVGFGIPRHNDYPTLHKTEDEAKAAAMSYVRRHLRKPGAATPKGGE